MNGKRALAWRNLMAAAIDIAIERGLSTWIPAPKLRRVFAFKLDGFPALAGIRTAATARSPCASP